MLDVGRFETFDSGLPLSLGLGLGLESVHPIIGVVSVLIFKFRCKVDDNINSKIISYMEKYCIGFSGGKINFA